MVATKRGVSSTTGRRLSGRSGCFATADFARLRHGELLSSDRGARPPPAVAALRRMRQGEAQLGGAAQVPGLRACRVLRLVRGQARARALSRNEASAHRAAVGKAVDVVLRRRRVCGTRFADVAVAGDLAVSVSGRRRGRGRANAQAAPAATAKAVPPGRGDAIQLAGAVERTGTGGRKGAGGGNWTARSRPGEVNFRSPCRAQVLRLKLTGAGRCRLECRDRRFGLGGAGAVPRRGREAGGGGRE